MTLFSDKNWPKIFVDIETRSSVKLIGGNLAKYTNCPQFSVICLSLYDDQRNALRSYKLKNAIPYFLHYLKKYYSGKTITLVAHNINFEYSILRAGGFFEQASNYNININFECTMGLCLALSLPASLEAACILTGTDAKKDEIGQYLISHFCIPDSKTGKLRSLTPDVVEKFTKYCEKDVVATVELYKKLPKHRDSFDNLKNTLLMNATGLPVDAKLAEKVVAAVEKDAETEDEKIEINPRSTKQVIDFCASHGFTLSDCKKATVELALRSDPPPAVAQILHSRLGVKSSIAKYRKVIDLHVDNRLYNLIFYYGAHTGRDSGRDFQPQNLPRGGAMEAKLLSSIDDSDFLRIMGYTVKDIAKGGLRSIVRCKPAVAGHSALFCGDFASIELRVLLWLSRDFDKLKKIKAGQDIYKELAAKIFKKDLKDVTAAERHVGKQAILGLGYGLGFETFSIQLPDSIPDKKKFAKKTVEIYRREYKGIVDLWEKLRLAVINCSSISSLGITITRLKKFRGLSIELPSGRRLFYCFFSSHGGEMSYFSVHPRESSKKVKEETGKIIRGQQFYKRNLYGGKIVHNLTQAIARDLLFDAHDRLVKKGYCVIARVHDELLAERTCPAQSLSEFIEIMEDTNTELYKKLPIEVEGWEGNYYRK